MSPTELATTSARCLAAVTATGSADALAADWGCDVEDVTARLTGDDIAVSDLCDVADRSGVPATWLAGQEPETLGVSLRLGRPPVGVLMCRRDNLAD